MQAMAAGAASQGRACAPSAGLARLPASGVCMRAQVATLNSMYGDGGIGAKGERRIVGRAGAAVLLRAKSGAAKLGKKPGVPRRPVNCKACGQVLWFCQCCSAPRTAHSKCRMRPWLLHDCSQRP